MSSESKSADTSLNGGESGDRSELLEELEEQRREVQRLRRRLIDQEAELGRARGRVAELESSAMRFAYFAARLQAAVYRVVHAVRRGLGLLRR
jgi:predicted nuclease with TOPRIM domain